MQKEPSNWDCYLSTYNICLVEKQETIYFKCTLLCGGRPAKCFQMTLFTAGSSMADYAYVISGLLLFSVILTVCRDPSLIYI